MRIEIFRKDKTGKRINNFVWEDGVMTGARPIVKMIEEEAAKYEGCWLSAGNDATEGTDHDHLKNPFAMMEIMYRFYNGDVEFSGDIPQIPPLPEGCVG